MANILKYIEEYKNTSFKTVKFNEVDNIILSCLSYIDFLGIVSHKRKYISLKDAAGEFFEKNTLKEYCKQGIIFKQCYKMLEKMQNTKRYGNLLLYNYIYVGNEQQQFSALCIRIKRDLVFISFEGTDHLIVGWKENFALCYKFPIYTQVSAINYLNKAVSIFDKNIIIGGHSKGGNLAMVAAMYAKKRVNKKISLIYNNDGPGLRKKEIESEEYKNIEKRLVHIIPNYSVVGLLLRHNENFKVIKSNRMDIMAHSPFTWQVHQNEFKQAKLSKISQRLDKSIILWLEEHDDESRQMLIDPIFEVIKKAGIVNVYDVKSLKKFIDLFKNFKGLDKSTKELFANCLLFNVKYCIRPKVKKDKIET